MRKYFLLSAVALMAATSANATTDYAEVTAKATIEVANELNCWDLNWGTIVVKQNNQAFTLDSASSTSEEVMAQVIRYDEDGYFICNGIGSDTADYNLPDTVTLTSDNAGTPLTLRILTPGPESMGIDDGSVVIYSELSVPANVKPGYYESQFTVSFTY